MMGLPLFQKIPREATHSHASVANSGNSSLHAWVCIIRCPGSVLSGLYVWQGYFLVWESPYLGAVLREGHTACVCI